MIEPKREPILSSKTGLSFEDLTSGNTLMVPEEALAAMEEYGKQMFNYALELAAENAKTLYSYDELVLDPASIIVDKESILKIKIP